MENSSQTLFEQAFASLENGDFEDAIDSFSAGLAISPEAGSAHRGRAIAYFQVKKWANAQEDFIKASTLDPSDLEGRVGYGLTLAMQDKIYPAIGVFEKLLQEHPAFVRGYIQLALLYYKLCVPVQGKKYMELALANRPTLQERRLIENVFKDESKLDAKRLYRPDFDALNKKNAQGS